MSEQDREVVGRVLEAFNSEQIERILAFTHPSVEVAIAPEVSAEPDVYRGHDGVRRYFQSFRDAMDEIRFEAEHIWDAGPYVVIALRLTARGRLTGIRVEQRSAGVWAISDGKITEIRAYASSADAFRAVRLEQ